VPAQDLGLNPPSSPCTPGARAPTRIGGALSSTSLPAARMCIA